MLRAEAWGFFLCFPENHLYLRNIILIFPSNYQRLIIFIIKNCCGNLLQQFFVVYLQCLIKCWTCIKSANT